MSKEQAEEKRQIIKHVKARIDRGEPKQQIMEDLSALYKDKVTIAKQLESTPSKEMKLKYQMYNYLLAAFLLVALIFDIILIGSELGSEGASWSAGRNVITANYTLSIVLDLIFVVGVLLYRNEIYSWIASRALITIFAMFISFGYYKYQGNALIYVSLALIVISLVLGLFLGVKLCPPRVPKVIEVDIDGTEKINKTIYVFPD